MPRKVEVNLQFQNYIETPPVTPSQMWGQASSSDGITMESWRKIWCANIKKNHERFGSFKEQSLGKLWGINKNKPAIIVGSGPSLGHNGHLLKDKKDILAVSCLHNYHFFEDRGIDIDYYVSLDASPIVLEEVAEGGAKTPQEYWDSTKNKKLLAFIGSPPELFEKWQGEVHLFTCPIGDPIFQSTLKDLESFFCLVSTGGNVLGASLYIAKAIFGSNPIAFVGADFSFGYDVGDGHHFHAWKSKYDEKLGNVMRGFDIFGNKAITWQSYFNFKNFFDHTACQVLGIYINCTEGGILGAYAEGNIMAIKQMGLADFLSMYQMSEMIKGQCENPEIFDNRVLF